MLALRNQAKYFSKVVTLPNGKQALVYFEIVNRGGQLVARAVHAEAILAESLAQEKVLALPTVSISSHIAPVKSFFQAVLTPYFKDLSFVLAQPTRAPSF